MMPLWKTAQWVCCSGAISPPLRQLLSPIIPFFVFLSSKAFKRGSKFTTSVIGAIDSAYQTQTEVSFPSIIHYIYWLVWIIFLSIKIVEIHAFFMVLSSLSFHFSVIYLSIYPPSSSTTTAMDHVISSLIDLKASANSFFIKLWASCFGFRTSSLSFYCPNSSILSSYSR